MAKHYWWCIPLSICGIGMLIFLIYNLFPTILTHSIRSVVIGMFIILLLLWLLCFVLSFFTCGYKVLRKKPVSDFVKCGLVGPIMILLSAVITVRGINQFVPPPRLDPFMQRNQFSQETWRSNIIERRSMAGDLVENILPGKSCAEIETLLGQSLDSNFGNGSAPFQCQSENISELRYFLGALGIFGDIDNIQIFFDEAGLYSHYEIYTYNS